MPPIVKRCRFQFVLCCLAAISFASASSAAPPEPITLKEHKGWVASVAYSPDGKTLATASADGTVRFWNATGKLLHTLDAHDDIVSAVAYSKDGMRLATASFDGTVKLWNVDKRELVETFRGHRGAVLTVAFNPNGRALAAGGIDGRVRVWELDGKNSTGRVQRTHASWVNAIAYRHDGFGLASVSSDNEVRFNPTIGKLVIVRPKLAEVRSVAYSPDSTLLATGTRYGITKVWNADGDAVATLKNKYGGDVWAVGFSPDGKLLAAVDGDWNKPSEVVLYDTKTWKEAARLQHTNEVLCVAWHPKKPVLAAGAWDKTTNVWDVSDLVKGK